jgi:hypothetical protein
MSDAPPSRSPESRPPPAALSPERVDDGWAVRLPWCMPRFVDAVVLLLAFALGSVPVLISLSWFSTDSLCFAIPALLFVTVVGLGSYFGARFALGRAFATRFELRRDGVQIGRDWVPAESLPEATRSHRLYRSVTNDGGSQSEKRIDLLHLGERSFACDVGPHVVDWLVDELNARRQER